LTGYYHGYWGAVRFPYLIFYVAAYLRALHWIEFLRETAQI
jgi:hypothetical protein